MSLSERTLPAIPVVEVMRGVVPPEADGIPEDGDRESASDWTFWWWVLLCGAFSTRGEVEVERSFGWGSWWWLDFEWLPDVPLDLDLAVDRDEWASWLLLFDEEVPLRRDDLWDDGTTGGSAPI